MINLNEAPEGYIAVEYSSCADCSFFNVNNENKFCGRQDCFADSRHDGRSVMFIKKNTTSEYIALDKNGVNVYKVNSLDKLGDNIEAIYKLIEVEKVTKTTYKEKV